MSEAKPYNKSSQAEYSAVKDVFVNILIRMCGGWRVEGLQNLRHRNK